MGHSPSLPRQCFRGASSGNDVNVAAGDFNNDGKLDLAFDTEQSNATEAISIYLGDGSGGFTAAGSWATINNGGFIEANDIDGDGNVDLYTGFARAGMFVGDTVSPGQSYALMGHGDGSFAGATTLPFAFTGVNLVSVKTSGKALTGFALNNSQTSTNVSLTAYPLNTNGTFSTGPVTTLSPVTINGTSYTPSPLSFGFGDFNNDGNTDLIAAINLIPNGASPSWGFILATGNGDGSFNTPSLLAAPNFVPGGAEDSGPNISNLLVADVNGDGKPDLLYNYVDTAFTTQVQYAGFAVQLGNGDGTFQSPKITQTYSGSTGATGEFPIPVYTGAAIAGGKLDLFAVKESLNNQVLTQTLEMFPGNGDGTFGAATTPPVADHVNVPATASNTTVGQVVLADMNGDGQPDLITLGTTTNGEQSEVAISLGNGDGTFQKPTILDFANDASSLDSLAVGDFDGDGKLDVAVGGANPPVDTGIFFGNGDGTVKSFTSGSGLVEPAQVVNFAGNGTAMSADINGDGKTDLILGRVVLINNGISATTTTPAQVSTTTTLKASASSITAGTSMTFTATVSPASGTSTPTGTVTFMNGTANLGTGTLNGSGVATYATSSLAVGSQSITAVYGGDASFSGSTSSAVTVTVTAATPASFSISASPASGSVTGGGSAQTTITVTPAGGFNQQVSFACSGQPTGGRCTFSPTTVTPNGTAAATTTLAIATTSASGSVAFPGRGSSPTYGATTLAMLVGGSLWVAGIRRRRTLWKDLQLGVFLLLSAAALVLGCGGGSSSSGSGSGGSGSVGSGSTTSQSYTVTITATAGSATQTAKYTLTVQ